ncbi:MAG TPA: hypothetical protein VEL75_19825 [Candidatus Methylomirabilis sp.]|nr:hypothetical protein [Candidatus Methylomirabilis sp.]
MSAPARIAVLAPALVLAAALELLAADAVGAAELPVSIVSMSSPIARPGRAELQIQTEPAASCIISVISRSGPAPSAGLESQVADDGGRVVWRWAVDAKSMRGRWPIVVTCQKGRDLGRLETSFQVR